MAIFEASASIWENKPKRPYCNRGVTLAGCKVLLPLSASVPGKAEEERRKLQLEAHCLQGRQEQPEPILLLQQLWQNQAPPAVR